MYVLGKNISFAKDASQNFATTILLIGYIISEKTGHHKMKVKQPN